MTLLLDCEETFAVRAGNWKTAFMEQRDFPPRQKAATFTIDQALQKMQELFNSGQ